MVGWETAHTRGGQPRFMQDFVGIWQAADKIVYSRTLEAVSSVRTRIERDFNPEAVRRMKASAGRDITVGGPDLAAQAIKAGLVDECHLFLAPIVVGGGAPSLPNNVPPGARAARRTPFRQRHGSPPLPHQDVRRRRRRQRVSSAEVGAALPASNNQSTSALTGVSVRPRSGFRCGQWCSACCGHTWVVCSRSITILSSV
jgi:RibD C-terminal domain